MTSLSPAVGPAEIAGHARNHWGIGNKSHWVRDVVYAEDHQHAYTGATAKAIAMLRNLAIGLIRLAGLNQIKRPCNASPPTGCASCPSWPPHDHDPRLLTLPCVTATNQSGGCRSRGAIPRAARVRFNRAKAGLTLA